MGLITNGQRNGFSPFRWMHGSLVSIQGGMAVRNRYLPGAIHNWNFHFGRQIALPDGNLNPVCWMLPRTGGGMSVRSDASGTLAANLIPTRPMSVDLTGSGDLEAVAGLVVSMLAAFTGSGTLTASITGRLDATIDMTGSGDLAANMEGIASMVIDMLGQGDLEATIAAFGDMSIDIVVTGTGLTTSNVGQAVWSALAAANNLPGTMGEKLNDAGSASNPWTEVIEAGLTAEQILRLIAAYVSGKTEIQDLGGGNAIVKFRGIADDRDAITGNMTGSERTSVVRNP